jgi:hypothetical protein
MSQLTREEKLASFQQLTKVDGIKTGREFAESFSNKARILIDHPHSYRGWTIIGPSSVRGFYYLKSTFPLDAGEKVFNSDELRSLSP